MLLATILVRDEKISWLPAPLACQVQSLRMVFCHCCNPGMVSTPPPATLKLTSSALVMLGRESANPLMEMAAALREVRFCRLNVLSASTDMLALVLCKAEIKIVPPFSAIIEPLPG